MYRHGNFILYVFTPFLLSVAFYSHAAEDLQASDFWIRLVPPASSVTAAFGKLSSVRETKLIAASSSRAAKVELHNHISVDGVMKMRQVDSIALKAHIQVALVPGSYHLMLIGLTSPVKEHETIDITLKFSSGETLLMQVPVRSSSVKAH